MRVPIVMLSGPAGSGKDTVAQFLVKNHGAVAIAQADPMKRLAMKLFGFSEETLWGPSERRNDRAPQAEWDADGTWEWVKEVLPDADWNEAHEQLYAWCQHLHRDWVPQHGTPTPATARRVLQTLGTEWGRAFSKNMWVDLALRNARALLEGGWFYDRAHGLRDLDCGPAQEAGLSYEDALCNLVVVTDGRFRNELLAVRAAGGATVRIVSPGAGLSGNAAQHSSETEQNSIPDSWFDVVLTNDKSHGMGQLENTVGFVATSCLRPKALRLETWEPTPGLLPIWNGEP